MSAGDKGAGRSTAIAIIDAQPIYRTGAARVLRELGGVQTVAEGSSAGDALQIARRPGIDMILLDTDIVGGWKQALASIVGIAPGVRVIVMSASEACEPAAAAMQLGARGYLLKQIDGADLLRAVRSVERGERYVTPSLAAHLIARPDTSENSKPAIVVSKALTPRELQIITQISVGATNKEVARELNISEKTVKHYMTIIMHKLQVRNRVEAVLAVRAANNRAA
jgi:DNA-binding NarL/FixJ family response regulator